MLQPRALRPYTIQRGIGAVSIRAVLARIGIAYWRGIGVASLLLHCFSIATPLPLHCNCNTAPIQLHAVAFAITIPRVLELLSIRAPARINTLYGAYCNCIWCQYARIGAVLR